MNSVREKITPECKTFAKRTMTLNAISVIFGIIAIILLIVSLVYIYMPAEGDDILKNRSTAGITAIFALLAILVTEVVAIWMLLVTGKLKECIMGANAAK
jgi:hypothetical protein